MVEEMAKMFVLSFVRLEVFIVTVVPAVVQLQRSSASTSRVIDVEKILLQRRLSPWI